MYPRGSGVFWGTVAWALGVAGSKRYHRPGGNGRNRLFLELVVIIAIATGLRIASIAVQIDHFFRFIVGIVRSGIGMDIVAIHLGPLIFAAAINRLVMIPSSDGEGRQHKQTRMGL